MVDTAKNVAFLTSTSQPVQLFVKHTVRQTVCKHSTFFARNKRQYPKRNSQYFKTSTITVLRIFSHSVRSAQKVKVSTGTLSNEISNLNCRGTIDSLQFLQMQVCHAQRHNEL
jgi:hypothetical protein